MGEYADRVERGGVRSQPWEAAYIRMVKGGTASDPAPLDSGVSVDPDFEYAVGVFGEPLLSYEIIGTPEIVALAARTYGYQQAGRMQLKIRAGGLTHGEFGGDRFSFVHASGGAQQQLLPVMVQDGNSWMSGNPGPNFFLQYVQSALTTYIFVILRRRIHGLGPRAALIAVNDE